MRPAPLDLPRLLLSIIALVGLIALSLWILRPFLVATLWAVMIAVACWPLLRILQERLWQRRGLAVAVMLVGILLVFVVPLALAVLTIVDHAEDIVRLSRSLAAADLRDPPGWLAQVPLLGDRLSDLWRNLMAGGVEPLLSRAAPHVGQAVQWLVGQAGTAGLLLVQFLLTLLIAALLFAQGEAAAALVQRFAQRLAGERGLESVRLAAQAIRGVALGVVVTALVQALVGGIGLAIAGVPLAALLTAAMFILCVAQVGAGPIMIPAVIWMYATGDVVWGTVLLVWTVFVLTMDNVLRPWLIKRGADLPLLLIFAGVIGGLLSLGIVGIFVGPVVLAVAYRLLEAWLDAPAAEPGDPPARAPEAAPAASGVADATPAQVPTEGPRAGSSAPSAPVTSGEAAGGAPGGDAPAGRPAAS